MSDPAPVPPKPPWRRYALTAGLVALATAVMMAALNYVSDPWGVWRLGKRGDWVRSRPAIRFAERLHKAHAVADARPDVLLLGNSRVIVGLDPQHPSLPPRTYNLGLSGANVYECLRYLQHAVRLHEPKLVLLAIDKDMFDAGSKPLGDFSEARLAVCPAGKPQPAWARSDVAPTIFSTDAVVESCRNLLRRGGTRVRYAGGMRDVGLMQPYNETSRVLMENENWRRSVSRFCLVDTQGKNRQLDAFRELLAFCASHHIQLIVFTNPVHAELLDLHMSAGEADFTAWFLQVQEAIAASSADVAFWDFQGFNPITVEPFPPASQPRSTLENYWEISHYRKAVGDLALARVTGWADPRLAKIPGFGVRLELGRVESNLQRLALERARWKRGQVTPVSAASLGSDLSLADSP